MKTIADLVRWSLVIGSWALITYLLWTVAWFWGLIWIIPGFIIMVNLVGFATLPLYYLVQLQDPEVRWAKQRMKELEDVERDSN